MFFGLFLFVCLCVVNVVVFLLGGSKFHIDVESDE